MSTDVTLNENNLHDNTSKDQSPTSDTNSNSGNSKISANPFYVEIDENWTTVVKNNYFLKNFYYFYFVTQ